MSLMLASVNSLAEACLARQHAADIIDLKEPAHGALGALDCAKVKEIVTALPPVATVSATVGDLPMEPDTLCEAVAAMAATGVDYVKIGIFPGGKPRSCIDRLSAQARRGSALVAVLFADASPDFSLIDALADAGFAGVMLDTMDKSRGSLTGILSRAELSAFVQTARRYTLLSGLAGSLTAGDVPELLPLEADYLGFRGALCRDSRRVAALDGGRVATIKALLACPSGGEKAPHGLNRLETVGGRCF